MIAEQQWQMQRNGCKTAAGCLVQLAFAGYYFIYLPSILSTARRWGWFLIFPNVLRSRPAPNKVKCEWVLERET